jgi:hypothetical protein
MPLSNLPAFVQSMVGVQNLCRQSPLLVVRFVALLMDTTQSTTQENNTCYQAGRLEFPTHAVNGLDDYVI